MNISNTPLNDCYILEPKVYGDDRGFFFESFNHQVFQEITKSKFDFVQDNHSRSSQGVLRGLHYQYNQPQGKLVRAVRGEIFDVAVDVRQSSTSFGKWFGVHLTEENKKQLWVPPGFAHGFVVLSATAEVLYKTTEYYNPADENCIIWNDAQINIQWPYHGVPVLSEKDKKGLKFSDVKLFS